ncbi:MAG: thioredoxin domain-containing protein [Chitinophagaceae bacterium]|nr:thioredoxin domain-containing protein [Chitinophagaceae bacterium]MCW5905754.1 thioredoxin domain-containing protein [Chitinophagaceae bacterium]
MATIKEIPPVIETKDVFVGDKKAPVTLMEFGDYESEECAKVNEIVKKILDEHKNIVRFNFRHFPLTKIHQRSQKAAEAAVSAAQDGKFWEMHNALFANRRNLGTTTLKLHAKDAGINRKEMLEELMNGTYGQNVHEDIAYGKKIGVTDIPVFFINGTKYTGKITFEGLSKEIIAASKKAKTAKKGK